MLTPADISHFQRRLEAQRETLQHQILSLEHSMASPDVTVSGSAKCRTRSSHLACIATRYSGRGRAPGSRGRLGGRLCYLEGYSPGSVCGFHAYRETCPGHDLDHFRVGVLRFR
jgi:hypothetical protein